MVNSRSFGNMIHCLSTIEMSLALTYQSTQQMLSPIYCRGIVCILTSSRCRVLALQGQNSHLSFHPGHPLCLNNHDLSRWIVEVWTGMLPLSPHLHMADRYHLPVRPLYIMDPCKGTQINNAQEK